MWTRAETMFQSFVGRLKTSQFQSLLGRLQTVKPDFSIRGLSEFQSLTSRLQTFFVRVNPKSLIIVNLQQLLSGSTLNSFHSLSYYNLSRFVQIKPGAVDLQDFYILRHRRQFFLPTDPLFATSLTLKGSRVGERYPSEHKTSLKATWKKLAFVLENEI